MNYYEPILATADSKPILLGKGAEGNVYLYKQKVTGEQVAIKWLKDEDGFELKHEFIQKSEAEANKCIKLQHPNIIRTIDFITEKFDHHSHKAFLVMEKCNGSLKQWLSNLTTPLDESKFVLLAMQIVSGVEYLHTQGIIHRDIKCSNILYTLHDNEITLKLADLARCKPVEHEKSLSVVGSLVSLAPEVLDGTLYSFSADIFSIGCVLYEMLTIESKLFCTLVRDEKNLHKTVTLAICQKLKYPKHVAQLIVNCLQLDPKKRPSIVTLKNQLLHLAAIIHAKAARSIIKNGLVKKRQKHLKNWRSKNMALCSECLMFNKQNDANSVKYEVSLDNIISVELDPSEPNTFTLVCEDQNIPLQCLTSMDTNSWVSTIKRCLKTREYPCQYFGVHKKTSGNHESWRTIQFNYKTQHMNTIISGNLKRCFAFNNIKSAVAEVGNTQNLIIEFFNHSHSYEIKLPTIRKARSMKILLNNIIVSCLKQQTCSAPVDVITRTCRVQVGEEKKAWLVLQNGYLNIFQSSMDPFPMTTHSLHALQAVTVNKQVITVEFGNLTESFTFATEKEALEWHLYLIEESAKDSQTNLSSNKQELEQKDADAQLVRQLQEEEAIKNNAKEIYDILCQVQDLKITNMKQALTQVEHAIAKVTDSKHPLLRDSLAAAYFEKAHLFYLMQKYNDSLDYFKLCQVFNPYMVEAVLWEAFLQGELHGNHKAAMELFTRVLEEFDNGNVIAQAWCDYYKT